MAWKQLIMFWMLNVKFYNLTILQFYNHASALDHSGCYIDVLACSICCEAKFHKNEQNSVLGQNLPESIILG